MHDCMSAYRGQKRTSDFLLGLRLQMTVIHHIGAGNHSLGPLEEQSVL